MGVVVGAGAVLKSKFSKKSVDGLSAGSGADAGAVLKSKFSKKVWMV